MSDATETLRAEIEGMSDVVASRIEGRGAETATLRAELESEGWRIYNDCNAARYNECKWYACTTLADAVPDCVSNHKPPSLVVTPFMFQIDERVFEQAEFSVTGDAGGVWLSLKAYSIHTKDAMASIPKVRDMLCAAWTAAAKVGA